MPKPSKNTLTHIVIFPYRKRFEETLRNRKWSKNCFVKCSTFSISRFQSTNKFVRHLLYTHRKERISKAYSQRIVRSWKQQTSQERTESLIQILNKLDTETKCRWLYGYNFSISGRGAKSVVRNDVPLDYDTVIAFASVFEIPVPRQWGREMSVPRLYVTDPFIYFACRMLLAISLYNRVPVISPMWYFQVYFWTVHIVAIGHALTHFKSRTAPCGTCFCTLTQNTVAGKHVCLLNKRNSQKTWCRPKF